jgi:hypothetical protein
MHDPTLAEKRADPGEGIPLGRQEHSSLAAAPKNNE